MHSNSAFTVNTKRPLAIKLPRWREIILIALLVSLYTQVPLQITDTIFVPSFVTLLILGPIILSMVAQRIYKYEAVFLLALFTLLLLSVFLSPGLEFIGQKLLGSLQTMVSVIMGLLTLKLLHRTGQRKVARVLFLLSLVLVVGSFLEVIGLLRPASDYFRNSAYANSTLTVYEAPTRDAQITGFERATFFTNEPSVLTKGFLAFVNAWLLVAYSKKNLAIGLLLTALLFLFTGSLVLMVSALISLSIMLVSEKSFPSLLLAFSGTALICAASFVVSPDLFSNALSRFEQIYALNSNMGQLTNDSIGLRLILPTITLINVWANSPFFGTGISGKEAIQQITDMSIAPMLALGNNNFTVLLTYFGLVGTAAFIGIFVWYFRKIRIRSMAFLGWVIFAYSLTGGGFESPQFWGYVFLLVWAVKTRDGRVDCLEGGASHRRGVVVSGRKALLPGGGFSE